MTNKENRIMKKLRSDVGASITFGLLLFLVCAVISAVVLVAGTTAAGRLSGMSKTEQRYYSVTSTAKLIQEELLDHVDAIQRWIDGLEEGDIPEALLEGLRNWIDANLQELIGRNIRYTWFGLTDDGYFVAYMPESWQELWFDTVMDFDDDYYGHLLIKYDANHLRKVTTYREGY